MSIQITVHVTILVRMEDVKTTLKKTTPAPVILAGLVTSVTNFCVLLRVILPTPSARSMVIAVVMLGGLVPTAADAYPRAIAHMAIVIDRLSVCVRRAGVGKIVPSP